MGNRSPPTFLGTDGADVPRARRRCEPSTVPPGMEEEEEKEEVEEEKEEEGE